MVNNSCETVGFGNNTSKLVSKIVKPISHRRISISLRQLLKIVKPEVRQELINAIANPDISRRNHTPCKVKRKKKIFNDTASESSSSSGKYCEKALKMFQVGI
ncbi:hypothetical protein C2G38_2207738 [Gigaspora rosea]|uniref:Uncharacterized protein n=1 Tax=Gigaspora rosea TaxID=44941 RepID=A0A397URN0_9GLOM|nr:hypothetical protein C2G38_2207738 [Gigaspora rosea]